MPRNQLLTRIRREDALLKDLLLFRPVYGLKQIHQGDYLRSKSKWAGAGECVDRNCPYRTSHYAARRLASRV